MPTRKLTQKDVGLKHGFRSGLEEQIAGQLVDRGVGFLYEGFPIPFVQPAKPRKYTSDLLLPNGILVESKGRFLTSDRQKHLFVKESNPDLDIRFVFSRSATRISKQSKTTYAKWCEYNGFLFADKYIPDSWINEGPHRTAQDAVLRIVEKSKPANLDTVRTLFNRN